MFITADHGEAFGEHGVVSHGTGLHDEQVRIPLLIVPPEGEAFADSPQKRIEWGEDVLLYDLERDPGRASQPRRLAADRGLATSVAPTSLPVSHAEGVGLAPHVRDALRELGYVEQVGSGAAMCEIRRFDRPRGTHPRAASSPPAGARWPRLGGADCSALPRRGRTGRSAATSAAAAPTRPRETSAGRMREPLPTPGAASVAVSRARLPHARSRSTPGRNAPGRPDSSGALPTGRHAW